MGSILASLISLISSSFFVQFSNAAITTMVAIVIAESGGDESDVALVAASYSLGFILGCLLSPPQIYRIGLVRAYAAAAGIMTIAIVALEILDGVAVWTLLRFLMGASFAAVMAISDAWINDKAPGEQRGRIIAVYSVALGLASILSQVFFLTMEATDDGFVLIFAISMNLAVVLVALGTSRPPQLKHKAPKYFRPLSFVSFPATIAAFTAGFCTTSLISVTPFYLTDHGVEDNLVAMVIGAIYFGRLVCQWPIGQLSDRTDRRNILFLLASVVIAVSILMSIVGQGEGRIISGSSGSLLQILVFLLCIALGGTLYPMYSVASALAFDRADGRPMMDISTTLLIMNSMGAILGPVSIMLLAPYLGDYSLAAVLALACSLTAVSCIGGKITRAAPENPTRAVTPIPENSVEMAQAVAELVEGQAPEEPDEPDQRE